MHFIMISEIRDIWLTLNVEEAAAFLRADVVSGNDTVATLIRQTGVG